LIYRSSTHLRRPEEARLQRPVVDPVGKRSQGLRLPQARQCPSYTVVPPRQHPKVHQATVMLDALTEAARSVTATLLAAGSGRFPCYRCPCPPGLV
jgi:hypothetical protein